MTQAPIKPELPSSYVTFEEFHDWLGKDTFFAEWVDGEIEYRMAASAIHQRLSRFLVRLLSDYTDTHNLGEIFFSPFLMRLPNRPSGREPDVMFVAKGNASHVAPTYLNGPADLAIEIVSDDSIERDYETKRLEYEQNGVREYWCIDPSSQSVLFCQRNAAGTYDEITLSAGRYDSVAVAGFWLQVEWLWQEPQPLKDARKALGLIA